jgi:CRP/FNR family transcriptional regulator, cyclic AMP receptor protein
VSQIARVLRACQLFEKTSPRLIDALAEASLERHLAAKRVIAHQGDRFPFLGVVWEGAVVAVASRSNGREEYLYEAGPYDTFAEIPLLDESETFSYLAAGEDGAVTILIPRAPLVHACTEEPALGLRLAKRAAHRARLLVQRLTELAHASTVARIAAVIAASVPDAPDWIAAPRELRSWSQAEIATRAGTVRVVAARVLRTLESEGAITLERGRIARLRPRLLTRHR